MPYWELYYHIVWSTKNREPIITEELEKDLHQYLRGKGIALGGIVHGVGGIEEHVHMAASIPPKISVAKFIADLKGASSHWVNQIHGHSVYFNWQRGYGVLTITKKALPKVVAYILNQKAHHADNTIIQSLEKFGED